MATSDATQLAGAPERRLADDVRPDPASWDKHHTTITVWSNGQMIASIDASLAVQLSLSSLGYGPYPKLAGIRPLSRRTVSEHKEMPLSHKKLEARNAIRAMQAVENMCYQ